MRPVPRSAAPPRRALAAVVLALCSGVALACYCPPQYQEGSVEPMFVSAEQALNESVQAVDWSLSAQLVAMSEQVNSALAVLTKAKAMSAHQVSDAQRVSAQMTAVALEAVARSERVKEAVFEYSPAFGQGVGPCRVSPVRNLMTNRDAVMDEERRVRLQAEVAAAPGRYVDPESAARALAAEHRERFCTADQARSGLCPRAGPLAGKSLSAATLFEPVMESDPVYGAKVAFVNQVAPLPDAPIPAGAAGDPTVAAYVAAKAAKDARVSVALASLKEVQLEYSGVDAAHGGADIPVSVRIENEVRRYGGNSEEAVQWTRALAMQNMRGLLVEDLKVKALDLYILERQYRQYERWEALLSVLVAREARIQAERGAGLAAATARQDARGKVH